MLSIDILSQDSFSLPNWAAYIDDGDLEVLAEYVLDAVEVDDDSRRDWLEQNASWISLAQQVMEEKNYPWPKAASVKFPLLTTAALQFHARAHQELLKDERVVLAKVIGRDDGGKKAARARRVEDAMSIQFLQQMGDWQDDMDRLLYVLPLIGTAFKKVYWDGASDRPSSELVLPSDMIVGYYAADWRRARKTHRIWQGHNEVVEQQRVGNYLDVDLTPTPQEPEEPEEGMAEDGFNRIALPGDTPHEVLECHCWYDMDDDGYEEPYIVTVDRESRQVLRIVPRYRLSDVRARLDGVILAIEPLEYIVPYKFFPAVDSNVYGTGFGHLLGPLNRAVHSLINQLIDAGTLANQQSGFLGRGVRISKGGAMRFRPGEWKELSATGDDLRKGIFPMPVKEPNQVLFSLLSYLVEAGKEVSSVAEVMSGQNPGQNQPYSTTATVLEQGMQVFLGIYKRVYRSLAREYTMVYNLNYMFLSDAFYNEILDPDEDVSVVDDFSPQGLDIVPEADPNMANSIRKQARVQALIEAGRAGMQLNKEYIQREFLESIDAEDIDELMQVQPPPPSEVELQDKQFYADLEYRYKALELEAMKSQNVPLKDEAAALANVAKAQQMGNDAGAKEQAYAFEAQLKAMDRDNKLAEHNLKMAGKAGDLMAKGASNRMDLEKKRAEVDAAKEKARNASTNQSGAGS
jgi:chaperonin GroES